MDANTIILLVVSGVFWLSGFWFLFRIPLCERYKVDKYPSVSKIIPARNEERNIGKALDSINSQSRKPDEVIVVNDDSTDRTREISLEKGATVIDSEPLPEGWLGKPWACYQGAKKAKGDLLMFLDSDIELESGGLEKILATYSYYSKDAGVVMSIAPYHKVEKVYEEFSAIFNIIMVGSMNAFTPLKSEPTGLFGPSLIVSAKDYFKINGHESVKNKILENVFMAEKFKKAGLKLKCFGGKGALSFRMYPDGLKELADGWTKAFASGASKTPFGALFNIILWISAGFLITIAFILSFISSEFVYLWAIFYILFANQTLWMLKRIGFFGVFSVLFFPINLLFFCAIFFRSLYFQITNKKTLWKSREVKA